jgi:hypothetical protein
LTPLEQLGLGERDAQAVDELVDEDVIADQHRRDHRRRRDLEGLDHERAQQERDDDRDRDRLAVLAAGRLATGHQVILDHRVEGRQRGADPAQIAGGQRGLDRRGPRAQLVGDVDRQLAAPDAALGLGEQSLGLLANPAIQRRQPHLRSASLCPARAVSRP